MRIQLIVVLWLLTCTSSAVFSQPVRVFVTSSAVKGGVVDKPVEERQAAAKDLVDILARTSEVVLVRTESEAQVVVEVTKRVFEATGERYRDPTKTEQVVHDWRVYATLKSGDYATRIMGESKTVTKKDAAKAVARQVTDWIAKNRAQLEKK